MTNDTHFRRDKFKKDIIHSYITSLCGPVVNKTHCPNIEAVVDALVNSVDQLVTDYAHKKIKKETKK
jgi:hypothetical protein